MAKDVFVQNCLHYIATISGDQMILPLDTQLHTIKHNEIPHYYVLYIEFQETGSISICYFLRIT
jgi:hypothetical protein